MSQSRIRNIFLDFNDGLVEILGAVSGFFGAFGSATMVLIAGSTTAVAGSLSMAAGVYVASSSEREINATEEDKKRFLETPHSLGCLMRRRCGKSRKTAPYDPRSLSESVTLPERWSRCCPFFSAQPTHCFYSSPPAAALF